MEPQRIWSKFTPQKDGKTLNLVIKEWPLAQVGCILDFYEKYFVTGESMQRAAGISQSEEALKEYRNMFEMLLHSKKHDILVCCLEDDVEGKNVIGVSLTEIVEKGETFPDIQVNAEEMIRFIKIVFAVEKSYDVAESLSVEKYQGAKGVCVNPDYRGLGIAQEFLRVRKLLCKEQNLPFTSAWMTAYGTQKAAARDGWKTIFELDIVKLEQQLGVKFTNSPPTFKLMVGRLDSK